VSLSLYDASVPVFTQILSALSKILDKAAASGIPEARLMEARLAPDMFAFPRQVQIATDHAKGATARLTGASVPAYADDEAALSDLKARIERTLAFVGEAPRDGFEGAEARQIELKAGGRELSFDGRTYLLHFALPNFFFHATTAYDILRKEGVALGKRDFLNAA